MFIIIKGKGDITMTNGDPSCSTVKEQILQTMRVGFQRTGEKVEIRAEIKKADIGRAIKAFGENLCITDGRHEGELHIVFRANAEDVYLWALQNADAVTVLAPQRIRDRLRVTSEDMNRKYLSTYFDWKQANVDAVTGVVRPIINRRFNKTSIQLEDSYVFRVLAEKNQCHYVKTVYADTCWPEILARLESFPLVRNIILRGEAEDGGELRKLPDALKNMRHLKKLECWRDELIDISVLRHCHELQRAELHCKSLCNADALTHLDELNTLDIADTSVEDVEFILHLPALKELWLGDSVKDIEPLYSATQIKRLYASAGLRDRIDMEKLYETNPDVRVI